jgi:heat shock protein HtpX
MVVNTPKGRPRHQRKTFAAIVVAEVFLRFGLEKEAMNTLRVGVLLVALTAFMVWVGQLVGGAAGATIALGLALAMNIGTFWFSDKLVIKMTKARPVSPSEAPELHEMVERLSARAGIPVPALYVVDDPSPNAFATGRSPKHGVVAVNTGLLDILNRSEVEGVVAHELAHIKHRDTLTMAITASIAGAIMYLAQFAQIAAIFGGGNSDEEGGTNPLVLLVIAMIAPLAAMMIQMGISRAREFEADKSGAEIAGRTDGLANALLKLQRGADAIPSRSMTPQTAHMAIVNPFRGVGGFTKLFMTHPPIEERVEKLRALNI